MGNVVELDAQEMHSPRHLHRYWRIWTSILSVLTKTIDAGRTFDFSRFITDDTGFNVANMKL
jgi:hypothetical protein